MSSRAERVGQGLAALFCVTYGPVSVWGVDRVLAASWPAALAAGVGVAGAAIAARRGRLARARAAVKELEEQRSRPNVDEQIRTAFEAEVARRRQPVVLAQGEAVARLQGRAQGGIIVDVQAWGGRVRRQQLCPSCAVHVIAVDHGPLCGPCLAELTRAGGQVRVIEPDLPSPGRPPERWV